MLVVALLLVAVTAAFLSGATFTANARDRERRRLEHEAALWRARFAYYGQHMVACHAALARGSMQCACGFADVRRRAGAAGPLFVHGMTLGEVTGRNAPPPMMSAADSARVHPFVRGIAQEHDYRAHDDRDRDLDEAAAHGLDTMGDA